MSLVFETKLGAGRDRIRWSIDDVPMSAGGLEMNLRPGLGGGMDLVTEGGGLSWR
jgi:hypothetical protein